MQAFVIFRERSRQRLPGAWWLYNWLRQSPLEWKTSLHNGNNPETRQPCLWIISLPLNHFPASYFRNPWQPEILGYLGWPLKIHSLQVKQMGTEHFAISVNISLNHCFNKTLPLLQVLVCLWMHTAQRSRSALAVTGTAPFSHTFSNSKIRWRKEKNYLKHDESYLMVCQENRYL